MADHLPLLALSAALSLGLVACSGLESGIQYPGDLPSLGPNLLTPENATDPAIGFTRFKVGPEACKGIDTHPIMAPLAQDDFTRFLEAQGVKIEPKVARGNLYWFDFPNGRDKPGDFVRLRLAVLDKAPLASADLHGSLLEHGPGWWGVRRSNLAILAPKASLHEAVAFAMKYKLFCWGMFTYAGNDDAYVVPGPYSEL
ncbi:MAG: hypothetical protein U0359_11840 [Byssovorax sp.]